ncbi:MAG: pitrilysin family protein [bacterium]|nr:pitrilysin family protein [bacterium]
MINSKSYSKTILNNGIRVVTESVKNVRSVSLGVCLTRGARDENKNENGISHFIEHLFFKGTERRSAKDIATEIDSIGGELNGFTAKEFTYFYARFLDEHLDKVWDLIADILKNSKFDKAEIERERGVILEEIKSFEDSPADQSIYLLTQALFEPHPLSYPIMGPSENVKKFTISDILKFKSVHYRGPNLIVVASGNLKHERLVGLVHKSLDFEKEVVKGREKSLFVSGPTTKKLHKNDILQVHIALGTRTIEYKNKDRYLWLILNTLIGGGMSSRLFQRLREKEGIVYEVASLLELLTDIGIFGVYLATDPSNMEKAIDCVWDEFDKLRKNGLEPDELSRTKEHLKGCLMLGLESTTARMVSLLENEIHLGRYVPPDEITENIEKVSEEDILSVAQNYLRPEIYSISKVGPKIS